jgi:predicted acylesterase/phospholipase RssA
LLQQFPAPKGRLAKLRVLRRIVLGQPIWSDDPLRLWLRNLFQELGARPCQLSRELIVVAASLADGRAIHHRFGPIQDQTQAGTGVGLSLVDALLESAGLPFCFRTWKSARYFDGGLCENLPVYAVSDGQR